MTLLPKHDEVVPSLDGHELIDATSTCRQLHGPSSFYHGACSSSSGRSYGAFVHSIFSIPKLPQLRQFFRVLLEEALPFEETFSLEEEPFPLVICTPRTSTSSMRRGLAMTKPISVGKAIECTSNCRAWHANQVHATGLRRTEVEAMECSKKQPPASCAGLQVFERNHTVVMPMAVVPMSVDDCGRWGIVRRRRGGRRVVWGRRRVVVGGRRVCWRWCVTGGWVAWVWSGGRGRRVGWWRMMVPCSHAHSCTCGNSCCHCTGDTHRQSGGWPTLLDIELQTTSPRAPSLKVFRGLSIEEL